MSGVTGAPVEIFRSVDDNARMNRLSLHVAVLMLGVVAFATTSCGLLLGGAECGSDADCNGDFCDDGACVECTESADCDDDERCDDGECERDDGSGEEGEGEEGEGEGGEGEAGEGEGEAGEGEGEGEAGEGEGEGEGNTCFDACDCSVGQACIGGTCTSPPSVCEADSDCERPSGTCTLQTCGIFGFCEPGGGEGEGEGEGEIPTSGLAFELSWSIAGDVDIHATEGEPYCIDTGSSTTVTFGPFTETCADAPDDCNYANCGTSSFGGGPDWDEDASSDGPADPVLQLDDTSGDGPEIITVAAPVEGVYLIGAYSFSNSNTVTTTLTVHEDGTVVDTITGTLTGTGDWLDLAIVHVSASGVVCVADVTDSVDECE